MRRVILRSLSLFGCALACASEARAQATLTFTPVADATLYEDASGAIANGSGERLFAGRTNNGTKRRAVVRFDVSAIPVGSTVTSVSLRMFDSRSVQAPTVAMNLHKVTASWGEGVSNSGGEEGGGDVAHTNDATWTYRFFPSTLWSTVGGDFSPTISATANAGAAGTIVTWSSATMLADVQGWVSNASTNFGWLVKPDEAAFPSAKRFDSRENLTPANRPQLTVNFTLPAGVGGCCLSNGVCVYTTAAGCAAQPGTFQGSGALCSPNPCPQPPGACCLPNGTCVEVVPSTCTSQGGTPQGGNVACSAVYCPFPLTPFVDALPIPGVAQPTSGVAGGAAHYDIYLREFSQKLHRDLPPTKLWGYNSKYPGDTIEAARGAPITVNWYNDLRDTAGGGGLRTTHVLPVDACLHGPSVTGQLPVTVTHLHGLKVAPDSDGFPDASFPPGGGSPLYTYPNDQPATTLWYHDHALGLTRLNVYMGLAGFYLIRDSAENALNIPRGEYEIPLVIQDRQFNLDGSLRYPLEIQDRFFGDKILVNGKIWPYLNVKRGKYRFRILNGSNGRTYTLALSNGGLMTQIGSDGGLLNAPVVISNFTIQPAERVDLVIDFAVYSPGVEIVLTNSAPAPFPGPAGVGVVPDVMKFVVQSAFGDGDVLPSSLVPVPRIPEAQAVNSRDFKLRTAASPTCDHDTWLINDLMWDDITDFVRIGQTEVWSFTNFSEFTHPLHVHLVQFQVLDRQAFTIVGGNVVPNGPRIQPMAEEQGWKDTVQAAPLQITRIIAKFDGYAGNFPMHCHILEHEDHEMMRQFVVQCDAPSISSPPTGVTVAQGAPASFTVGASGDVLTYQWRKNGVNLVDGPQTGGSSVAGATSPTLTITNTSPRNDAAYTCVITNPCGQQTTAPVNLIITPACPGDVNLDGNVTTADLAIVLGTFGSHPQPGTLGDINGDGAVNTTDLTILLGSFGRHC